MASGCLDVAALIRAAGFAPADPLTLAAHGPGTRIVLASGAWPSGKSVVPPDLFYAASLAKQLTGAAVALLVRDGALDPDGEIPARFLPRWTARPTARQLLHHIGSLPEAGSAESARDRKPWTNSHALGLLAALDPSEHPPGSAYAYSNLGYILLARLVEEASGMPFPDFAARRIFAPLGLAAMAFADGDVLPDTPHAALLGPSLPLSTGDGGLWTTAEAFADWLDAQNRDAFGIARLTQQDAVLASGRPAGYGWGFGLRSFRDHPLYIHGGGWTGARAKAVRCPALGLSVVALTAGDSDAPVQALVDAVLDRWADAAR